MRALANNNIEYDVEELYRLAKYMVKRSGVARIYRFSDIDDLIQELVYKMYRAIHKKLYKRGKKVSPATYLCSIAKHEIYSFIRKKNRKKNKIVKCVGDLSSIERELYMKRKGVKRSYVEGGV